MERELDPSKHWSFRPSAELVIPTHPLAEHLAPEMALSGLRANLTRRNPEGLFKSAWSHAEFAALRTDDLDDEIRKKYLNDSAYLLGRVINGPGISEELYLDALTLNSYLPAYTKRALGQPITSQDCSDIYVSLGYAMNEHARMLRSSGSRRSETITLAASARTRQPNLLLWPTSPREESSHSQPDNHDCYGIRESAKDPAQLKLIRNETEEREYNEPIKTIYLLPILDHACMRAGLTNVLSFGQSVELMVEAMIAETMGKRTTSEQILSIEYFCRSVAARSRFNYLQPAA